MKAENIKLIHKGNFLSYYEINYIDESGVTKTYEMVSKTGNKFSKTPNLTLDTIGKESKAVILLVFNQDHSKMLISKEFRLGVNQYVYNEVAGLIDPGETPEEAAARELYEETGLKLTKIIKILKPTFTCAPVTDDITHLIICEAEGEITGSDNIMEEIHSKWYTKEEVKQLLDSSDTIFAGRLQAFAYMWACGSELGC